MHLAGLCAQPIWIQSKGSNVLNTSRRGKHPVGLVQAPLADLEWQQLSDVCLDSMHYRAHAMQTFG